MSEFRYEINNSIDTLREVVDGLRFIATKDIEEDKKLLMEGWNSNNSGKAINICSDCQNEIYEISKKLEETIDEIKTKF